MDLMHVLIMTLLLIGGCQFAAGAPMEFALDIKQGQAIRERLKIDLKTVEEQLRSAGDSVIKSRKREIQQLSQDIEAIKDDLPEHFRAIMPMNDIQRRIYALNTAVLNAKAIEGLTAYSYNRWDPLFPLQIPDIKRSKPKLTVDMAINERRSECLNLTNATNRPINAVVNLAGLAGGDNPDWVSVREVLFTDTYIHYPIAAALPEAATIQNGYQINIPAGTTRQVWFVFNSKNIRSGKQNAKVMVSAAGLPTLNIPLRVNIHPVCLPDELSISVGGWDYTDADTGSFDAKLVDQKTYIDFLKRHAVNTPWATGNSLKGYEFDEQGKLSAGPDFELWDKWIAKWKDADKYAMFVGVGGSLQDEPAGTDRFNTMVGEWASALVRHAGSQGIKAHDIWLLLVDEPHEPAQIAAQIAWAKAIKKAEPELVIWNDPAFEEPEKVDPDFFKYVDMLSPLNTRFTMLPQSYRDFYLQQQKLGKDQMFYACINGKHLDPFTYHRGLFWMNIKYEGLGAHFWAFGDEGGAPSSFNPYASPGHMFSPLFLDAELGVVDGKHMQGIVEGAEDYEYYIMLRDRIRELENSGVKSDKLIKAKKLLVEATDDVVKDVNVPNISWWEPKDRSKMDNARIGLLKMLVSLQEEK